MKKIFFRNTATLILLLLCFFAKTGAAQLAPGDLAIVGVNGKGFEAEIAVLTLKAIPPNTMISLGDGSWTNNYFSIIPMDGVVDWTTPGTIIPSGTVITFKIKADHLVREVAITPELGTVSIPNGAWKSSDPGVVWNTGDNWFLRSVIDSKLTAIYGFANWDITKEITTPSGWDIFNEFVWH